MSLQQRLHFITLGVSDLAQSRSFYEQGLGWTASERGKSSGVVYFPLQNGLSLALFPKDALATEVGLAEASSGFSGTVLSQNVGHLEEVVQLLHLAEQAGGRILKPAEDKAWGGHVGYFADLDGYVWEVVWNPHFELTPDGQTILPE
ncbi:VOC family protein [Vampirovibrio chlorellavorus]|uniref:VOC family protein n=1 Tax=Vampirovibrio chlorellavorus TaxID=758823 RepID=UPI0026ECCA24|nr:VOC family protein [Vampirovibrio chlorellavorus]